MLKHALLSASGAKRWISCPPSARLEEEFPDSTSSFAEEGTVAHTLSELKIRKNVLNELTVAQFAKEKKKIATAVNTEMEYATDTYVDLIVEKLAADPKAILLIEQRLDFSYLVPDGFGTGDAIILTEGRIEVIDLKYGKGVPVSAIDNPQARLYALGAIHTFGCLYNFTEVKSTIVQPRLDSVSTETLTVDELNAWAEEVVRPAAKLADAGEGDFWAGEHCRFCRAGAICRARAEQALQILKHDFQAPALLDPSEIPDILKILDGAKAWIKELEDYAFDQAVNHDVHWDGFKIVAGRSNRVFLDEDLVAKTLFERNFDTDQIYNLKLKGITEMEKLLGKTAFGELLGELVTKPQGKPTLVAESDKRDAISLTDDFIGE